MVFGLNYKIFIQIFGEHPGSFDVSWLFLIEYPAACCGVRRRNLTFGFRLITLPSAQKLYDIDTMK